MNAPFAKNHMAHLMPASLGSRRLMDDAVLEQTDTGRGLGRKIADAVAYLAAMPRRRAVLDELSTLTDRELADIGVARGELKRVFEPAFVRDRLERGRDFGIVDYKL